MKKILGVPLVSQKKGSVDCGPASTAMIMKYFKKSATIATLRSELDYVDEGTYLFQNGQLMQEAGLKTTLITAHPHVFPADVIKRIKTKSDLDAWLAKFFKAHPKNKAYQKSYKYLRKYLDSGGTLKLEIPSVRHIRKAIADGNPIFASTFGGALGRKEGLAYHFVVVDGYQPGKVHVVNPLRDSKRRAWWPDDQFMFAVHSCTMFDPDNGGLLVVSK